MELFLAIDGMLYLPGFYFIKAKTSIFYLFILYFNINSGYLHTIHYHLQILATIHIYL